MYTPEKMIRRLYFLPTEYFIFEGGLRQIKWSIMAILRELRDLRPVTQPSLAWDGNELTEDNWRGHEWKHHNW